MKTNKHNTAIYKNQVVNILAKDYRYGYATILAPNSQIRQYVPLEEILVGQNEKIPKLYKAHRQEKNYELRTKHSNKL